MSATAEEIQVGMELTPAQRDQLDRQVFERGKATAIFAPEGTGPMGDLVVVWPTIGIVINPAGIPLQMRRVA